MSVVVFTIQVGVPGAGLYSPLAVVELPNGTGEADFVLTTPNFYVVTRYNWSAFYALAVLELGQAVARNLGRA